MYVCERERERESVSVCFQVLFVNQFVTSVINDLKFYGESKFYLHSSVSLSVLVIRVTEYPIQESSLYEKVFVTAEIIYWSNKSGKLS